MPSYGQNVEHKTYQNTTVRIGALPKDSFAKSSTISTFIHRLEDWSKKITADKNRKSKMKYSLIFKILIKMPKI